MKHTIRQVFHSGKFVVGFSIFVSILLIVIIYPRIIPYSPLEIIGQGNFFPPGVYVNVYDSILSPHYTLDLDNATANRIAGKLNDQDRLAIKEWLVAAEIDENSIEIENTAKLLDLWVNNYDPSMRISGMTNARRNYFVRLNTSLKGLMSTEEVRTIINKEEGQPGEMGVIAKTDYANINEVPNVRWLPLGTDNFGRDVLTELVAATRVSLAIGFVAGLVATFIGLTLGLLAGYVGGLTDDVITFITNLFTVIPSLILLILISFSIGQDQRGPFTIAVVIGFTSWVWTARAVRAQVFSLRNRDHVNLSKLSGHSVVHIIVRDILPYIASYVVMALILQISSAILLEAGLSIIGLGPRTTEVPTLG
ncbi:MAG TPA: ABC transporter permease, partial [Anaerolineae bacterium]|nr:ABC transporter permease [Anaerolineae bacterium]